MGDEETEAEEPTIFVRGEGGYVFELSLPLHETIEEKLRKGAIVRVQPDGEPYTVDDQPDGVPTLPDARPGVNEPKAKWIGWAVKNGATVTDAETATKADLIEKYGVNGESAAPVEEVDPATAGGLEGEPGEVIHNENRDDGQGNTDQPTA